MSLEIREEKLDIVTILHLSGDLTKITFLQELQSSIMALLNAKSPEFILLECLKLSSVENTVFALIKKLATLFVDQARELAICSIPDNLSRDELKNAVIKYYPTQNEAVDSFKKESKMSTTPNLAATLKLSVLAGPIKGTVYLRPGGKEITIGRHSQCTLSLPDDIRSSRFHSKVYEKNGVFFLEDLKSSNGTIYKNSLIKEPVQLSDGDRFQVGETYLEVSILYEENTAQMLHIPPIPSAEPIIKNQDDILMDIPDTYGTLQGSEGSRSGGDTMISAAPLGLFEEDTMKISKEALKSLKAKFEAQSIKMPPSPLEKEIKPQDEKITEEFPLVEFSLPVPVKYTFNSFGLKKIGDRYEIQEKTGESLTSVVLRCVDSRAGKVAYLQFSKIVTPAKNLTISHPSLLTSVRDGEFSEKKYYVFENPGEPIKNLPLSEIKVIQIGTILVDILLFLHESGISGFDVSPWHIFYREDDIPRIALLQGIGYEKMCTDDADVFSLGVLLLELSTGISLPYSPFGTLDVDKIQKPLKALNRDLAILIIEILSRKEKNLEKIGERLKTILLRILSPKANARRSLTVQVLRMGESLVYTFGEGMACSLPWKDELARQINQNSIESKTKEELVAVGQKFYKNFWPQEIIKLLAEIDLRHIILALDQQLISMPWEMAHDGENFLGAKFRFTRKILPVETNVSKPQTVDIPRILIVAGMEPWAQKIKESVASNIGREFPELKIKTANTSDNSYETLLQVPNIDIFHFIGSAIYKDTNNMDSGWMLDGSRKLLKMRFLENAPRKPKLVIIQSDVEPAKDIYKFISLLYQIQIPYTIGTVWPVKTEEYALSLYRNLLHGLPVDIAVQKVQESYKDPAVLALSPVLYGHTRLYFSSSKK